MKRLFLFIVFFPTIIFGQGINFEKDLQWYKILETAKKENKYIFLDFYATWCGPCKWMDNNVYLSKEVGEYYNANFISAKVQVDSSKDDGLSIKKWYFDANVLSNNYSINTFPSYVFFSSDGTPVHKYSGALNKDEFIQLGKDSKNLQKQYYRVLKNFQPGKLDTAELKGLSKSFRYTNKELSGKMLLDYFYRIPRSEWANEENLRFLIDLNNTAEARNIVLVHLRKTSLDVLTNLNHLRLIRAFQQDTLVQNVVFEFLSNVSMRELKQKQNLDLLSIFKNVLKFKLIAYNYINTLSKREALKKENISFIANFINNSDDKGFEIFYYKSKRINDIMKQKGYAESRIRNVITREEIEPILEALKKSESEPDWVTMERKIKDKYGKNYAERTVLTAKPGFYFDINRKDEFAQYLVVYVDKYASIIPESAFYLNNMAWDVFLNTSNEHDLRRANHWMDIALKSDSTSQFFGAYMDTKANIIYKLGFKEEAIELEEKAIALIRRRDPSSKSYAETLEKMKRGENTWEEK